jgi:hypothetical protein
MTPRTDAKERESENCDHLTHAHYGWKFARQLERENKELLRLLSELIEHRSHCFIPEQSREFRHLLNWTDRARAAIAKAECK